jgi:hypothetical protein
MQKTDLHELRKDPLLGRWVAVLNQSKAPSEYVLFPDETDEKDCLFCTGRKGASAGNNVDPESNPSGSSVMVDKGNSESVAGLSGGRRPGKERRGDV